MPLRSRQSASQKKPWRPPESVCEIQVIDQPHPEEKEKLVSMARGTGFFTPEEIDVIVELLDSFFGGDPTNSYFFIAFRETAGSEPLGFACYGPAPMTEGTFDLYWIVVDKAYQNKKIGRALLETVEAETSLRGGRALYIETSDLPYYLPTRAFYERMGYDRAAHLPDYYKIGDGKITYRKWLANKNGTDI